MKIAFKGKFIKDLTFNDIISKLKENDTITLIGTAEQNQVKIPSEKIKFKEDLTDAERAEIFKDNVAVGDLPAGLVNLGNTCYAASTLQMFKRVPEFADLLYTFNDINPTKAVNLVNNMKSTFTDMNAQMNFSVQPVQFIMSMLQNIPQFQDVKTQQDAEECLSSM